MSKRKIWNVNEKKHYKMYKSGKQWFFAGMGIVAGLFGAGSTTIASADETPKGANLDLSKSKNLLATKTSATIPGSTS
ncbi:MAG: KxYKxGKxW signal peptide domain-containing protein, partial [Latilactobacillus curvatus]|nr:KxYKxGKxW signal peptide domain-containing protein [Latilactobacillus curvatus]